MTPNKRIKQTVIATHVPPLATYIPKLESHDFDHRYKRKIPDLTLLIYGTEI